MTEWSAVVNTRSGAGCRHENPSRTVRPWLIQHWIGRGFVFLADSAEKGNSMFDDLLDVFDRKKSSHKSGGIRGAIGRAIAGDDHSDRDRRFGYPQHDRFKRDDDHSYRRYDDDDDVDYRGRSKSGRLKRAFDFD